MTVCQVAYITDLEGVALPLVSVGKVETMDADWRTVSGQLTRVSSGKCVSNNYPINLKPHHRLGLLDERN